MQGMRIKAIPSVSTGLKLAVPPMAGLGPRDAIPRGLKIQVSSMFMAFVRPQKLEMQGMDTMVTVTLSKRALARLKQLQKEGESVSDVILRLGSGTDSKGDLPSLKELEGGLESSEIWEDTEKKLYASRSISRL
jgi:predicted CopG family antitoxin